jgi:hypothetical protein
LLDVASSLYFFELWDRMNLLWIWVWKRNIWSLEESFTRSKVVVSDSIVAKLSSELFYDMNYFDIYHTSLCIFVL